MSKEFRCEACRKSSPSLHMRDMDGKWVCAYCIPAKELDACPGLRKRLGLQPRSSQSVQRKKAA